MTIRFYDDEDNLSCNDSLDIDQLEICDDKLKCSEVNKQSSNFINTNQDTSRFVIENLNPTGDK